MKFLQNLVANCLQLKYEINYAYLLQFVNMETLLQQTSNKSKLNMSSCFNSQSKSRIVQKYQDGNKLTVFHKI